MKRIDRIARAGGLLLAPCFFATAHAATYTVNTNTDPATGTAANCVSGSANPCALRDAIAAATGNDTINFNPSVTLITVTSQLALTNFKGLVINGAGNVTMSGGNTTTVFSTNGVSISTINGLKIVNGSASFDGGGIFNNGGTLTLTNSTLSGNRAPHAGGAIFNSGKLTVINSSLSGNSTGTAVSDKGGAIFNRSYAQATLIDSTVSGNASASGGGLYCDPAAPMTLINTTISGNSAVYGGGGLYNRHSTVTLTNSTLSGNTTVAGLGRGSAMNLADYPSKVILANTVFDKGAATVNLCASNGGTVIDNGGNLASDGSCFLASGGNTANILLGSLQNNGGPTLTMLPAPGSAAIDAGIDSACNDSSSVNALDQRGVVRPQGGHCDSGAVEVRQAQLMVTVTGSGSVSATNGTSNGPNIANCSNSGGTCSAEFFIDPPAPQVTLSETPDVHYHFGGWGGACDSSGHVTFGVNATCTATFDPNIVSGLVNGLGGSGLRLTLIVNNTPVETTPAINSNGAFAFATPVAAGATYAIAFAQQPTNLSQNCAVSADPHSGTMPAGNANGVQVTCTTNQFAIGGSINGLNGSGLKLLLNGDTAHPITPAKGTTSFSFSPLTDGTPWTVTVDPSSAVTSLSQTCAVASGTGSGTLAGANANGVVVNCTTNAFAVSGSISGLNGSGLKLLINGGNAVMPAKGATSFSFPPLVDGTAWNATVDPSSVVTDASQTCVVVSGTGTGTLAGADVNPINVLCATNAYKVGGSVTGLTGSGLILQLNGGNDLAVNGSTFTFTNAISSGSSYIVGIAQQPSGQTCGVTDASGTVTDTNITGANGGPSVSCAATPSQLTLTVDDGGAFARYGQVVNYTIALSNIGSTTASGVSVSSTASAGLDLENATWVCGATSGATCTASGSHALTDTATLPAHGTIIWIVSVPVSATSTDNTVELDVSATGATAASDVDTLVIFRSTFDVGNANGTNAPTLANANASEVFMLPERSGNRIDVIKVLREGGNEVRVERVPINAEDYVRLLASDGAGERASAWMRVDAGAVLAIGWVDGTVLLEGPEQSLSITTNLRD